MNANTSDIIDNKYLAQIISSKLNCGACYNGDTGCTDCINNWIQSLKPIIPDTENKNIKEKTSTNSTTSITCERAKGYWRNTNKVNVETCGEDIDAETSVGKDMKPRLDEVKKLKLTIYNSSMRHLPNFSQFNNLLELDLTLEFRYYGWQIVMDVNHFPSTLERLELGKIYFTTTSRQEFLDRLVTICPKLKILGLPFDWLTGNNDDITSELYNKHTHNIYKKLRDHHKNYKIYGDKKYIKYEVGEIYTRLLQLHYDAINVKALEQSSGARDLVMNYLAHGPVHSKILSTCETKTHIIDGKYLRRINDLKEINLYIDTVCSYLNKMDELLPFLYDMLPYHNILDIKVSKGIDFAERRYVKITVDRLKFNDLYKELDKCSVLIVLCELIYDYY